MEQALTLIGRILVITEDERYSQTMSSKVSGSVRLEILCGKSKWPMAYL